MTYAPPHLRPRPMTPLEMSWRYVSANHPLPKRHQAHPRNTSPNDFQAPWQFRHALIFVYYRQAPNWGRELFLPGGRPPVNVTCKGGRSPNSARIRDTLRRGTRIQRLVSGECQARCPLADVLCISVITQIYSWNWPNRRAHFRWTGNETAVARAVCDPVQRGLDEFHDAK